MVRPSKKIFSQSKKIIPNNIKKIILAIKKNYPVVRRGDVKDKQACSIGRVHIGSARKERRSSFPRKDFTSAVKVADTRNRRKAHAARRNASPCNAFHGSTMFHTFWFLIKRLHKR